MNRIIKDLLYAVIMTLACVGLAACIAFLFCGCVFPEPDDPDPVDSAQCEDGQAHLEKLECVELLEIPGDDQEVGTEDDLPWSEWCRWVQDSGIDTLDLECILNAETCFTVEECL